MRNEERINENQENVGQSEAEKVLGVMPSFEKRELRSKDDIRAEIRERLDTNEKIEELEAKIEENKAQRRQLRKERVAMKKELKELLQELRENTT